MGAYLSSPVRDKISEDKDGECFTYGASSMQGWRVSQEDAHNCCPDFDQETSTALFAVYDGHGGGEVAQYTAMHLPNYVKSLDSYKSNHLSQALEDSFIGFDEVLTKEDVIETLRELAGVNADEPGDDEDDEEEEAAALQEEAEMPIQELLERYGSGGTAALANLRKREKFMSPMIRRKKGPESDDADTEMPAENEVCLKLERKLVNGHSDNENNENIEREISRQQESDNTVSQSDSTTSSSTPTENVEQKNSTASQSEKLDSSEKPADPEKKNTDCDSTENSDVKPVVKEEAKDGDADSGVVSCAASSSDAKSEESSGSGSLKDNQEEPSSTSSVGTRTESNSSEGCSSSSSAGAGSSRSTTDGAAITSSSSVGEVAGSNSGSSSSAAAGGSGSSAGGSSMNADGPSNSSSQNEDPQPGSSSGRTRKKRTSIIPAEGEDESSAESSDDYEEEEEDWGSGSSDEDDSEVEEDEFLGDEDDEDDENDEDEVMTGGEEPGSDSGCTSVVALLRGRDLYVANAGDSRCVVSRGGKAFDMSVDHKPEDEPERARITKAGGRVTLDGRVNGGLNLSRAIGDHCYKQNKDLGPKEQMITALPDVRSILLTDEDEFMVLACDGIWNVMTSQDAVTFIKAELDSGTKNLSAICEKLFDHCLAPNTDGDGTGCDNMTCIIVCFKHASLDQAASVKRRASNGDVQEESSDCKKSKQEDPSEN